MKNQIIPVFFTIDNKYVPYLDCAIRAMIQNASTQYNYHIIVLYEDVSPEDIAKIVESVHEPFKINFIEMKEEIEGLNDRVENRLRCDYFTMTIYFRLFIAEMFPEYDKGIYIDSDVIIPGDISEMFNLQLGDNIIGACPDHSVVNIPELASYMENSIGTDRYHYINSGVLLMNLKMMRDLRFTEHFLYLLNKYHFDCIAPDQDYLNAICKDKILFLDECWDAMPSNGLDKKELENPKLIHYNLFQKPWCYDNIAYADYFWKYAEQSPFLHDILKHKANYTPEQKKSDAACLQTIIRKGGVLGDSPVTFRKMYEIGEKIRI